jgi:hypothetical protein
MIDHEVYVEQPPYFEVRDRRDWVYLLNKALYGLKQSPLLWSNDLKQALIDIGFEQSVADESIFIYDHNDMYIILDRTIPIQAPVLYIYFTANLKYVTIRGAMSACYTAIHTAFKNLRLSFIMSTTLYCRKKEDV